MTASIIKRLINTEEYQDMAKTGLIKPDENTELIQGEIFTMSPVGSKHAAVVKLLSAKLFHLFSNKFIISVQDPVHLNQWTEPQPDIALLKFQENYYADSHPQPENILLVIEVADTSYEYDHQIKKAIYANAGIPKFWIVNLNENRIEVFHAPEQDEYKVRKLYFTGDSIPILEKEVKVNDVFLNTGK